MSTTFTPNIQWLEAINDNNFDENAIKLFRFQYENVLLYREYCQLLGISPEHVQCIKDIPFLPINFFKTHQIINKNVQSCLHFESSGTTGMTPSKHFIAHPEYYELSFRKAFAQFYGHPKDYIIVGLLPSYLERKHSSLVYMVRDLIEQSEHPMSGFYLYETEKLATLLQSPLDRPVFLIGVTFALLDFAEMYPMNLQGHVIMETGGMKGRKEEWTRMEVHDLLKSQWNLKEVHSEYGMSELLSQAYATANGLFHPAPTMRVLLREENDPLLTMRTGSGCANIIDLANIDSCAFIATEDIAKVYQDGSFEILGRRDAAALRGCSLMAL